MSKVKSSKSERFKISTLKIIKRVDIFALLGCHISRSDPLDMFSIVRNNQC